MGGVDGLGGDVEGRGGDVEGLRGDVRDLKGDVKPKFHQELRSSAPSDFTGMDYAISVMRHYYKNILKMSFHILAFHNILSIFYFFPTKT